MDPSPNADTGGVPDQYLDGPLSQLISLQMDCHWDMVIHMEVSIDGGTPKWMVYNRKYNLEIDDNQRYPYFRNPPYSGS